MPRLRNAVSGVVVNVSDDTAARLGSGWEPVDTSPAKHAKPTGDKPKANGK